MRDCRAVFDADLDPARVHQLMRQAVGDRGGSFVVRVTVYDPALDLGRIGGDAEPHILVTHRAAASAELPPLRVRSVPFARDTPEVKHVGLFSQLRARRRAQRAGFDDALFVHPTDGTISEGGTWNAAFIDAEHVVRCPPPLPGRQRGVRVGPRRARGSASHLPRHSR
ncbi:aminotransferase class IV [Streptomyces crystallinus]|uniref:aminotransferase class IV n=1 Tax=Streptomyces crystallinus TaxID=68191 RepID=UPI003CD08D7D